MLSDMPPAKPAKEIPNALGFRRPIFAGAARVRPPTFFTARPPPVAAMLLASMGPPGGDTGALSVMSSLVRNSILVR